MHLRKLFLLSILIPIFSTHAEWRSLGSLSEIETIPQKLNNCDMRLVLKSDNTYNKDRVRTSRTSISIRSSTTTLQTVDNDEFYFMYVTFNLTGQQLIRVMLEGGIEGDIIRSGETVEESEPLFPQLIEFYNDPAKPVMSSHLQLLYTNPGSLFNYPFPNHISAGAVITTKPTAFPRTSLSYFLLKSKFELEVNC